MKVLAIIPARSGSKGIPHKNIKLFKGKPLIYWSIKQALDSKYINRIIVSTDSQHYADIAKNYGAETPFLRPKEISEDLSTDYEFLKHCLDHIIVNENYFPDIIVQLRPTYPNRTTNMIDNMIKLFIDNYKDYDSLRTVIPFNKSPYKMYTINDKQLIPLFKFVHHNNNKINEPYNQCRQILPQCYLHNGYVDIIKPVTILFNNSVTGSNILPYIMNQNEVHDIDNHIDFDKAEQQ
jgi:CMP-N-acetylneuraminic acid synthetase